MTRFVGLNSLMKSPLTSRGRIADLCIRLRDHFSGVKLKWPIGEGFQKIWRRGRDSNPRYGFPYSGFQDWRHQPLGHLSNTYSFTTVRRYDLEGNQISLLFSSDYKSAPEPFTGFQDRCHQPLGQLSAPIVLLQSGIFSGCHGRFSNLMKATWGAKAPALFPRTKAVELCSTRSRAASHASLAVTPD